MILFRGYRVKSTSSSVILISLNLTVLRALRATTTTTALVAGPPPGDDDHRGDGDGGDGDDDDDDDDDDNNDGARPTRSTSPPPEHAASGRKQGLAAIMLEPLQGEGGIKPGTREYFALARKIADDNGAILICDEVQVGMG